MSLRDPLLAASDNPALTRLYGLVPTAKDEDGSIVLAVDDDISYVRVTKTTGDARWLVGMLVDDPTRTILNNDPNIILFGEHITDVHNWINDQASREARAFYESTQLQAVDLHDNGAIKDIYLPNSKDNISSILREAWNPQARYGRFNNNPSRAMIDEMVAWWKDPSHIKPGMTMTQRFEWFRWAWDISYTERYLIMPHLGLRTATVIATETFTGTDGDLWTTDIDETWVVDLGAAAIGYDVASNEGAAGGSATGFYYAIIDTVNEQDIEVLTDCRGSDTGTEAGACGRVHDGTTARSNLYGSLNEADSSDLETYEYLNTVGTRIAQNTTLGTADATAEAALRFRIEQTGATTAIGFSHWPTSGAEPTFPELTVNDDSYQSTTGEAGVHGQNRTSNARTCFYDDLTVDDLAVASTFTPKVMIY